MKEEDFMAKKKAKKKVVKKKAAKKKAKKKVKGLNPKKKNAQAYKH